MKRHPEKALRVHLGLVVAELLCVSAFVVELDRARSGNTLSWAYVFEWPILGGYAIFVWRKLLRSGDEGESPLSDPSQAEADALERYNRFLARAHRDDEAHPTGE